MFILITLGQPGKEAKDCWNNSRFIIFSPGSPLLQYISWMALALMGFFLRHFGNSLKCSHFCISSITNILSTWLILDSFLFGFAWISMDFITVETFDWNVLYRRNWNLLNMFGKRDVIWIFIWRWMSQCFFQNFFLKDEKLLIIWNDFRFLKLKHKQRMRK